MRPPTSIMSDYNILTTQTWTSSNIDVSADTLGIHYFLRRYDIIWSNLVCGVHSYWTSISRITYEPTCKRQFKIRYINSIHPDRKFGLSLNLKTLLHSLHQTRLHISHDPKRYILNTTHTNEKILSFLTKLWILHDLPVCRHIFRATLSMWEMKPMTMLRRFPPSILVFILMLNSRHHFRSNFLLQSVYRSTSISLDFKMTWVREPVTSTIFREEVVYQGSDNDGDKHYRSIVRGIGRGSRNTRLN